MSRSDFCRKDINDKYQDLFKKKEKLLGAIDPDVAKRLEDQGIKPESFKPLKIDEVADEIDKLREKFKDPIKFQKEAKKLLADMQAERINKKIDFYLKQMQDLSLQSEIIVKGNAKKTLKNFEELFDVRLDNRINHLTSKNVATLEQMLTKAEKNILSEADPEVMKNIYNAMEGYNLKNIDDSIIKMAGKIRQYFDFLHKQQTDAGFRLGHLHNYTGKRSYDGSKIRKNKDQAVNDLMDSINVEKTFPHLDMRLDQDQIEYRKIVERIIDGRIKEDITVGSADVGKLDSSMRSSLEARQTRERKLVFKPGKEGEWAVKWGKNTMLEQLVGSARTVAKVSATREIFGVNPKATSETLLNAIKKEFSDDPKLMRATTDKSLNEMWAPYNGTLGRLGSSTYLTEAETVALIANNIKSVVYMSKLGKTTLSAIVDLANAGAMLDASTGQGIFKSYSDILIGALADSPMAWRSYITGSVPPNVRAMAEELGVFVEAGMGEAMRRAGIEGSGTRFINKTMDVYDRINPIGKQTAFHDLTALLQYQNAFAKMAKLKEIPEEISISLSRAGMSDKYMPLIRDAIGEAKGTSGRAIVFSPRKIEQMSDANLKIYKEQLGATDPRISTMSIDEFRRDTMTRVQIMFDDFRNNAVPKPGGKQKRALSLGEAGTIKGELVNSLAMLKSFSLKMLEVNERILGSSSSKQKKVMRSIAFASSMTAMGYVALTLKDLASNRTPRSLDDRQTYVDAFVSGGAGGIYADFLVSAADPSYNNFAKALVGPMAGPIEDMVAVSQKAVRSAVGDKEKGFKKKDLKKIYRNIPGQNHLVIRPILDYLFLDAHMRSIDPQGYRRSRRAMRKRGQKPLYR
jgi:hypothetical protein